jgi:hypothetical protein
MGPPNKHPLAFFNSTTHINSNENTFPNTNKDKRSAGNHQYTNAHWNFHPYQNSNTKTLQHIHPDWDSDQYTSAYKYT